MYAASAARASHLVVPPPGAAASGGGSGGDALFSLRLRGRGGVQPPGAAGVHPSRTGFRQSYDFAFRFYLEESELSTAWYNVRADMKNKPAPLLNPGTLKPMTARELDGVFCDELVQQELDDTTAYILSQLYHDGLMEATGVEQTSVFEAAEH